MDTKKSIFEVLNAINCNEHTEKKNGLTYLSWAWAWTEVKKAFPSATYTIYETASGIPYFTDGKTCWVKTGVTIEGIEHVEYLPIMDFRNNSIPLDKVTSMDMNKTIQRSLTKCCARHGLGLYIYAGEDLPDTNPEVVTPTEVSASEVRKAGRSKRNTAPVTLAPTPGYEPMDDKTFNSVIRNYVRGVMAKSGDDYRTVWQTMTGAGSYELQQFDIIAEQYRQSLNEF